MGIQWTQHLPTIASIRSKQKIITYKWTLERQEKRDKGDFAAFKRYTKIHPVTFNTSTYLYNDHHSPTRNIPSPQHVSYIHL